MDVIFDMLNLNREELSVDDPVLQMYTTRMYSTETEELALYDAFKDAFEALRKYRVHMVTYAKVAAIKEGIDAKWRFYIKAV